MDPDSSTSTASTHPDKCVRPHADVTPGDIHSRTSPWCWCSGAGSLRCGPGIHQYLQGGGGGQGNGGGGVGGDECNSLKSSHYQKQMISRKDSESKGVGPLGRSWEEMMNVGGGQQTCHQRHQSVQRSLWSHPLQQHGIPRIRVRSRSQPERSGLICLLHCFLVLNPFTKRGRHRKRLGNHSLSPGTPTVRENQRQG